jgi:hypothetical protein
MADVQKSAFALSSATLMMAPAFTTDVFSLTPDIHSVGMAQEVTITVDSSVTELLNGVAQVVVDSRRTGVRASVTANVFEMTTANFLRAQSMADVPVAPKRGVLTAPLAAGAVSISLNSDPIPGETASAITSLTDIPAGSVLLLQRPSGETDYIFPTKSSGAATGTGPYVVPIAAPYVIPAGVTFPAGTRVWIVQQVGIANMDKDDLFGVKITGTLSNFDRPVVAVFPKVRIVSGFTLAFTETSYGAMPWQLGPLMLSKGEATTGRLSEVGTRQPGLVYVGG